MELLRFGIIGGLGLMVSPMAAHLGSGKPARMVTVHDRGAPGAERERARSDWHSHGAKLVSSLEALIAPEHALDGLVLCCGKNGDDAQILRELFALLAKYPQRENFVLCHMSTVSSAFPTVAAHQAKAQGVKYVNYPLTGGPAGARAGTMLVLASGPQEIYSRLEPMLSAVGKPRYFGERPAAGAEVKLIGHLMVFNSLFGISSGVAAHAECFAEGVIGGASQTEFFDFLNTGAGGSKQWDLLMRNGVESERWETGFLIKHAAVDALYAAQLCIDRRLSRLTIDPMLNAALALTFVLKRRGPKFATHALVRELLASQREELDDFIGRNGALGATPTERLKSCIEALPPELYRTVLLEREALEGALRPASS